MDSTDALVRELVPFLGNLAQLLDEMKIERQSNPPDRLQWTSYCEDQRQLLTNYLRRATFLTSGKPEPAALP